jgi:exodeoxyribonuclease V alpha subunit
MTIHRFLGYDGNSFKYNKDNNADIDLVIVDEAGQLSAKLNASLLSALTDNCCVIYVGDSNQLKSIEPGNVLEALGECLPGAELREVRRTNPNGPIGMACSALLSGSVPVAAEDKGNGFYVIPVEDSRILDVAWKAHQRMAAIHKIGIHEVRMMAPTNKLVDQYNDYCRGRHLGPFPIIARKNNYKSGYFNGDLGIMGMGNVEFVNCSVPFDKNVHQFGYGATTFVTQGHEFNCAGFMLPRLGAGRPKFEELYTALTRAKERFVLLGCIDSFRRALKRQGGVTKRITLLSEFIQDKAVIL